ncbi:MAG: CopD family protein [Chloroflexi bacterium]|nr:CopD family protein [Chloroflexota bacterium]
MLTRRTQARVRWFACLTFVCLAGLIGVRHAWAHPQIIRIEPPPDAQLTSAPAATSITFNEPIEALSTLALYDSQGRLVADGGGRDPDDPTRLALALPRLTPAIYTVVWTAAGSDGHVVRGNFAFTVLGPAAAAAAPTSIVAPMPAPAAAVDPTEAITPTNVRVPFTQSAVRWMLLLGATGTVGAWVFWRWALLPARGPEPVPETFVRRWRRWQQVLLALVLLGSPLLLALFVRESVGRLDAAALRAGFQTRQGMLLLTRVGLAAALLALIAVARDGAAIRRWTPGALALGAALLLTYALAGHAGAAANPLLPVTVAWMHLTATSVWVGGLWCFVLCLPLPHHTAAPPRLLLTLLGRFSRLALLSVLVLVVSGIALALRELPGLAALWLSPYGQALSAKLLLFGAMIVLGAFHLLLVRPRIGRGDAGPWVRRFRRSLPAEAGLAVLVLGAAGLLTSMAPPTAAELLARAVPTLRPTAIVVPTVTAGPTRTPVPSRPFDQTLPAGDLRVRLAVSPASLGENRFQVQVRDAAGQPVAIQLARLAFVMREMDMGENILEAQADAEGDVTLSGSPLSMVGDWQITVLVRRAGLVDVTVVFDVPVGE